MKSATNVDAHIGRSIRARRTEQGTSQAALAEQIGVSWQQVQKYEAGTSRVAASRLFEIARALGVTDLNFFFPNGTRRRTK